MKKRTITNWIGIVIAVLLLMTAPLITAQAGAQQKVIELEGIGYNVNSSMADNLKSLTGKAVYFSLDSGKTLTGTVKAVGNHLVHVEKMEGKEYFDALISIDGIRAIDTRFRDYQK